ncbi:MAG TPA: LysM domain-containing protein [Acidimicrobiales bacterium]|nr:LysM domain-containing protein [Acidimicrobiales bacterium]
MVAVTTTTPTRRSGRARHLSVAAASAAPARIVVLGPDHDTARCGCHRVQAAGLSGPAVRPLSAATYRRRRLAALVVVVGLAIAAWAALGALGGALTAPVRSAPPPATGEAVTVVEVGPGDSLWSIARRLQPEGDLRPLVDRLAASNGGAAIHAGERLVVG